MQPPLAWFCISSAAIDDVDFTAAATLRRLHHILDGLGIRLVFAEVSAEVQARLDRYQLTDLLGSDAFFESIAGVVDAYRQRGMEADPAKATEPA